jgi:hypothetical protein
MFPIFRKISKLISSEDFAGSPLFSRRQQTAFWYTVVTTYGFSVG